MYFYALCLYLCELKCTFYTRFGPVLVKQATLLLQLAPHSNFKLFTYKDTVKRMSPARGVDVYLLLSLCEKSVISVIIPQLPIKHVIALDYIILRGVSPPFACTSVSKYQKRC